MSRAKEFITRVFVVPINPATDRYKELFDLENARTDPLSTGRDEREIERFCAHFGESTSPGSTRYPTLVDFREDNHPPMPKGIFHVYALIAGHEQSRAAITTNNDAIDAETFFQMAEELIFGWPKQERKWLATYALPMVNPSVMRVELVIE